MLKPIEQKVFDYISHYSLLPAGKKVLLAVSGGADSVALLKIMLNLKLAAKVTCAFHIAHINHQLRGRKSLEDAEFVKSLAKISNLPVTIENVDVKKYSKEHKQSIETAARNLRLEKLAIIAKKNKCSCIAAAHQKNDNAETIIHRILRGTGFKGLAGIRPKTDFNGSIFIRPLLCVSRQEIEDYLSSQNIDWQTDHTNIDCRFTRNHIRHRLIPFLRKQSHSDFAELLFDLSARCLTLSDKIENLAAAAWNECVIEKEENIISMNTDKFNSCPSFVRIEIIQKALKFCGVGLQKFTNEHYDKILKFIMNGSKEKTLQLPCKVLVKKEQKTFNLGFFKSSEEKSGSAVLKIPGRTNFAGWTIETNILSAKEIDIEAIRTNKNDFVQWFNFDKVKLPVTVRCRQKGDRFKPFGHISSKKVSKFLKSIKTNLKQRKMVFIVCDNKKILWLSPIRRSIEAKVDTATRKILKIRLFTQK